MGLISALKNGASAFSGSFRSTVEWSPNRSQIYAHLPSKSEHHVNQYTRTELLRKAMWVYERFGIVKEGIHGIARHTVGKGIHLQLESPDEDWNRRAVADVEDWAMSPDRVDISGRRTLYQIQRDSVEDRLLRGEFFAANAENPRWSGAPSLQLFDSGEIAADGQDPADKSIVDGVRVGEHLEALEYFVRDGEGGSVPVDAAGMIHWYKPHSTNSVRGVTDLAQAVNPLVDIHDLIDVTTTTGKLHQALGVVMKRARPDKTGKGAFNRITQRGETVVDADATDASEANQRQDLEKIYGGAFIAYLDPEKKEDLQLVSSDSPSPLVESFITDLLMRDVCLSWGVPPEFFWAVAGLTGSNQRAVFERADLFFQTLAFDQVSYVTKPTIFRYLEHRMATGKLRRPQGLAPGEWIRNATWQGPRRVSVDHGRDAKADLDFLGVAGETLQGLANKRGGDSKSQMRRWVKEFEDMKDLCGDCPEAYEVWKANRMRGGGVSPAIVTNQDDPKNTEDDE